MNLDSETWARTEPHLAGLPGSGVICERIRVGADPWAAIGAATSSCTSFPAEEFAALLQDGDFDVRWPLTFAAWYWGASGASVDVTCAKFLADYNLRAQALEALREYASTSWVSEWASRFARFYLK